MEHDPESKPAAPAPQLVVIGSTRPEPAPVAPRPIGARQRLEDEFRQRFLETHPRSDLVTALHRDAAPAATFNGRT